MNKLVFTILFFAGSFVCYNYNEGQSSELAHPIQLTSFALLENPRANLPVLAKEYHQNNSPVRSEGKSDKIYDGNRPSRLNLNKIIAMIRSEPFDKKYLAVHCSTKINKNLPYHGYLTISLNVENENGTYTYGLPILEINQFNLKEIKIELNKRLRSEVSKLKNHISISQLKEIELDVLYGIAYKLESQTPIVPIYGNGFESEDTLGEDARNDCIPFDSSTGKYSSTRPDSLYLSHWAKGRSLSKGLMSL